MKVKFFKVGDTGIVNTYIHDDDGNRVSGNLAVIGQVKDLLALELIFDDNTEGNLDKWLVIYNDKDTSIREFNSKEEAKAFLREDLL